MDMPILSYGPDMYALMGDIIYIYAFKLVI